MIVENNPKSLPGLLLLAAVCGGLIVFFWRDDPLQRAEAERKQQETVQQAVEWQTYHLPVLQHQAQAEIDRINNERWLAAQRTQRQAQSEAAMTQLGLYIAYGFAAIVGVAALGLTFIALGLLWCRWLGNPWRDAAYRRGKRELARDQERLSRMPGSAPREVAPQKLNGSRRVSEAEHEAQPQI